MICQDYDKLTPQTRLVLAHHGILGQKWGKRNGPPYPLKAQSHSTSEEKAGWQNSLDKSSGSGNNRVSSVMNSMKNTKVSGIAGFSEEVAVMAVALLSSIAVRALTNSVQQEAQNKLNEQVREERRQAMDQYNKSKKIKSLDDAPRLSKPMSAEDSMKVTNPDFPKDGTTWNCAFCTTAMALREKGYDVVARKLEGGVYTEDFFKSAFNSETIKMRKMKSGQDLLTNLASNGDGSYGNLSVEWKTGGGHSVFWKVENGQTHIYDGQSGEEMTADMDKFNKTAKCIDLSDVSYNRFDNCEPTDYALAAVDPSRKK